MLGAHYARQDLSETGPHVCCGMVNITPGPDSSSTSIHMYRLFPVLSGDRMCSLISQH